MDHRYSKIEGNFEREIVLLKGRPCSYGKCKFCNYTLDNSENEDENFKFNKNILRNVTGEYNVLEVINSGNACDLDLDTLNLIKNILKEKQIKVLYLEMYLNKVKEIEKFRKFFDGVELRFRIGLESFDDEFRKELGKNFIFQNLKDQIVKNYYSACIMVGIKGQSKEMILNDIKEGLNNFSTITVNKWVNNTTEVKADNELSKWFITTIYPIIKDNPRIEVLIDNKDLGVFEQ